MSLDLTVHAVVGGFILACVLVGAFALSHLARAERREQTTTPLNGVAVSDRYHRRGLTQKQRLASEPHGTTQADPPRVPARSAAVSRTACASTASVTKTDLPC